MPNVFGVSAKSRRRRSIIAGFAAVATSAAATLVFIPASTAVDGTGVYAAWQLSADRTAASGTFTGTVFPGIEAAAVDSSLRVATSATLTANTPFGAEYGTSRGQQYLTSALASGRPQGTITLTFATPPAPLTWSFALGDVDAEDVAISATNTAGEDIDVRAWKYVAFNYASGATDLPVWDPETQTVVGNVLDTDGASMWVRPTDRDIATITLTQIRQSGFPQYQLWIAADVLTEADVAAPDANDGVCTVNDTALVNGGFELPVIPDATFRQPNQRDVPGWNTTASDGRIEIWSSGFNRVVAEEGRQFAEINATQASELFQVVDTLPGETLTWSLLHRARGGGSTGDTMSVNIGAEGEAPNATYTFTDVLADGWVRRTGEYTVPEGQTRTRFGFESGRTASASNTIGNFLDDIYFTTVECLPAEKSGGETVEPELTENSEPSPSPEVSPEASPSPEATEGSGSEGESSENGNPDAGATTDEGEGETPESSPSPTASPSPSPTVSPSPNPSPSPTTSPTNGGGGGTNGTTTTSDPVPVAPNRSIVVDPISDGGAPEGSTISSVESNRDGRVRVIDDAVQFTPKPGFIGETNLRINVVTPDGEQQRTVVRVAVGTKQTVITRWTPPRRMFEGLNRFGPGMFMTNAGQQAKVSVQCERVLKIFTGKPDPKCSVVVGKEGTYISVRAYETTAVIVKLTAPKRGQYLPLNEEFVYRITK